MKDKMDAIYTALPDHNAPEISGFGIKLPYILAFAEEAGKKILDAGCGQGTNLITLINEGYDAFGIDVSSVCCDKFLADWPHKCIDILSYCEANPLAYDGVLCSGVLEHLDYSNVDDTIRCLSKSSNKFLIGIANHADKQSGFNLHPIQKDEEWWIKKLKKFFSGVEHVVELYDGRFFFIKCTNRPKRDKGAKIETKPRVRDRKDR